MNKHQLIENLKAQNFPEKIIRAFAKVPRENFLPENLKQFAYEDQSLPLEKGAAISQPYTIAFMLSLLEVKPNSKVLEIGSGCGYVLALLANLTKNKVDGIEIITSLAESSKSHLKNYKNISVINKNGENGYPKKAPFDRILISAAADNLPTQLYNQLTDDGILVCPIKNSIFQIKKIKNKITKKEFHGFVFVPLITNSPPESKSQQEQPKLLQSKRQTKTATAH